MRSDQMQSLVFGGMRHLSEASFVLLRFVKGTAPHEALSSLLPYVSFDRMDRGKSRSVQLGITPRGLTALGMPPQGLPFAFRDPLASTHHQRVLGDAKDSAPATWAWNGDDADLVTLLYASSSDELAELEANVSIRFEQVAIARTLLLDDNREHFGFRDGMGNPRISAIGEPPEVPLGEFVLGYPDGMGEIPAGLIHEGFDFSRDGSYLVVRQLAQDVAGFWGALRTADEDPVRLGSKLIGRWPDGRLLTESESFADDPLGLACPRGAHVRRAHPRDALSTHAAQVPTVNRHRLLRRGRPYGPPAHPDVYPPEIRVTAGDVPHDAEAERGLLFVCLCADIARQFEHVQQSWLNNAKHDGLHDEVCPISSASAAVGDARRFTIPRYPVRRRLLQWPIVVRVRGTAYALLVGRESLSRLCAGGGI